MSVSCALENLAKEFNMKYACKFDFATFDLHVEEFTFLRPNGGWTDVYISTFASVYTESLEKASVGSLDNLNGEAMLDDFEYMLMRPYANESDGEIKHRSYVGMDRITRLEHIGLITMEAPKNFVELFAQKYRSGQLTLKQMKSELDLESTDIAECIKISAYVKALESVNESRSAMWRTFHPFKNSAEKRYAALLKSGLAEYTTDEEEFYDEISAAAYETFDGYKRANANLSQCMHQAREEMARMQKMNEVIRESL